jgi:diguanylate cyclase (GGDEF)-like protein
MPTRPQARHIVSSIGRRVGLRGGWGEQLVRSPVRLFFTILAVAIVAQAFQETLRAQLLPDLTGTAAAAVAVLWLPLLLCVLLWRVVVRPLSDQHLRTVSEIQRREEALGRETDRLDFDARLHGALELAEHEADVLAVVERALPLVGDGLRTELLLADASDAHLRRAVSDAVSDTVSCTVTAPGECPAVRQGSQLDFADSEALDACPRLRGRVEGPCAATCSPVSIMGTPVGVLHHVRPLSSPASADVTARLGSLSARVGARIGMVRALADREMQAMTDSLTGLPNRRAFEQRFRNTRSGDGLVVAMCDLDHFKKLNDAYGHDAGDRALRVFGDVLRATVRPEDTPARLGGEEFGVLLPGCDLEGAEVVLARVRAELATRLTSGRVPSFTMSAGLARGADGAELSDLLAAADAALYAAKRAGRDRVVRAGGSDAVGTPVPGRAGVNAGGLPDSANVRGQGRSTRPSGATP